ncbi:choice-of-anchor M domain-containing protein [Streptomyces sp. NPDC088757]|uniref:choice-of-anchor M domain-containing protein n=1 Tax=Streptomyces sp. NPDC088757 TaxID=3365889 RepID=UPI0037FECE18
MRTRNRLLTVTGVAAAALSMAGINSSAFAAVTLSSGHVDVLDTEYDGSAFHLHVHDESVTPDVEYDPADVTFQVKAAAKTTRPAGSAYNFLGATGSTLWILPQSETDAAAKGVLWPGFSTEELATGVLQNDRVTYTLTGAQYDAASDGVYEDSTADFSVYGVSGSTVTKYYDGGDGLTTSDARNFTVGDHKHYNWAFEGAGTYKLTFKVSGKKANGTAIPDTTASYVFKVVN